MLWPTARNAAATIKPLNKTYINPIKMATILPAVDLTTMSPYYFICRCGCFVIPDLIRNPVLFHRGTQLDAGSSPA
jgi:hypothetical protein